MFWPGREHRRRLRICLGRIRAHPLLLEHRCQFEISLHVPMPRSLLGSVRMVRGQLVVSLWTLSNLHDHLLARADRSKCEREHHVDPPGTRH